jgi:hypothetical protein
MSICCSCLYGTEREGAEHGVVQSVSDSTEERRKSEKDN